MRTAGHPNIGVVWESVAGTGVMVTASYNVAQMLTTVLAHLPNRSSERMPVHAKIKGESDQAASGPVDGRRSADVPTLDFGVPFHRFNMSCHPLTGRAPFQQNVGPVANGLGIPERARVVGFDASEKVPTLCLRGAQPDVARRR